MELVAGLDWMEFADGLGCAKVALEMAYARLVAGMDCTRVAVEQLLQLSRCLNPRRVTVEAHLPPPLDSDY